MMECISVGGGGGVGGSRFGNGEKKGLKKTPSRDFPWKKKLEREAGGVERQPGTLIKGGSGPFDVRACCHERADERTTAAMKEVSLKQSERTLGLGKYVLLKGPVAIKFGLERVLKKMKMRNGES